jgi:ribonuclease P protein component
MEPRNTLKKSERLKSRKSIERLFREGKSISVFPFKIFYLLPPPGDSPHSKSSLQAGFGVSSRLFRKAVDRNRIKRLSREAWRLQRHALSDHLREKGRIMEVFLIYTGKQLPDLPLVTQKIGVALLKLLKEA